MLTTEKIEKITRQRLFDMLLNFEKEVAFTGCAFGSISYKTDESESRTVNKKKVLQKQVETRITVGSAYEKRVNRSIEKQGEEANFTAQGMSGKYHISKLLCKAVKDETKNYLCCVVEHDVVPKTQYFHEGQPISYETAVQMGLFMPSHFTEKKTAGRGYVAEEDNFHFFTLGIEKIQWIKFNGVKFQIED